MNITQFTQYVKLCVCVCVCVCVCEFFCLKNFKLHYKNLRISELKTRCTTISLSSVACYSWKILYDSVRVCYFDDKLSLTQHPMLSNYYQHHIKRFINSISMWQYKVIFLRFKQHIIDPVFYEAFC